MRYLWLILFGLIFLLLLVWNIPVGKSSETLPAVITIAEPRQIGVHSTKESEKMFNFGTTFPGTKVRKFMNLTRGNKPPAKVHITATGEMQGWMNINMNDFILDDPVQVDVTISIPENAEKRTYTGNITVDYINTYGLRLLNIIS